MCKRTEEFSPLEILRTVRLTFVRDILYIFDHLFTGAWTKLSVEDFPPHDFFIFISLQ